MTALGRFATVALAGGMPLLAATRPVTLEHPVTDAQPHPYCAVLDADVFSESAPGLRGLHLMQDGVEIPFLTTVSEPQNDQTDAARILRLREENGALLFDLAMPPRAYTALHFKLRLQDFVAVAEITAGSRVGEFKLFDLSRDHLARQTAIELPEMHESILHVALRMQGKALHADDLEGVDVLPDRAGQSLYTTVAEAAKFTSTVRETIAEFDVQEHVPVQRIRFETAATNFLRRVRVEAWPVSDPNDVETISGTISATHRDGLADAQLTVPMTLGANLEGPAHVRVILENNSDVLLPLKRVALEMREHKICFDAKSGKQLALVEGSDTSVQGSVPGLAQERWDRAGLAVLSTAVEPASMPPGSFCQHESRLKIFKSLIVAPLVLALFILILVFIRLRFMRRKSRTP